MVSLEYSDMSISYNIKHTSSCSFLYSYLTTPQLNCWTNVIPYLPDLCAPTVHHVHYYYRSSSPPCIIKHVHYYFRSSSPPCIKINSKTYGSLEKVCLEFVRLSLPVKFQDHFIPTRYFIFRGRSRVMISRPCSTSHQWATVQKMMPLDGAT